MTYSFRTNGNFIDFVHTDNTNQAVESVLRSLHNTSRCVTWSLPEDTTRISFVVDDIRVDNFPLSEIDFDGTAIDSQDDFETGIIAAFPGLAGGGSPSGDSSYLVVEKTLTDAQIKALPTTPFQIIAAPGAGKQILVDKFVVFQNGINVAYDNVDGASVLYLAYGDDDAQASEEGAEPNNLFINNVGGGDMRYVAAGKGVTARIQFNPVCVNNSLKLIVFNSLGDLTMGNAANTLKVTVYYVVNETP